MVDASVLAVQAVGGFTVGALIGYAFRKLTKWIFIGLGFLLLPIFCFWQMGVLDVDWERVNMLVGEFMQWLGVNIANATEVLASAGAFGVSGLFGFVFGFSGGFGLRHNIFSVSRYRFVKKRRCPSNGG